jgi:glucosamine--fructose-6-phosphate aminotransferase (isomerizing)
MEHMEESASNRSTYVSILDSAKHFLDSYLKKLNLFQIPKIYLGKSLTQVPDNAVVFFPVYSTTFFCGLTGIVAFKNKKQNRSQLDVDKLISQADAMQSRNFSACYEKHLPFGDHYLQGIPHTEALLESVRTFKLADFFCHILKNNSVQAKIASLGKQLNQLIQEETAQFSHHMGHLDARDVEVMARQIENLKDIHWCLSEENAANITKTKNLIQDNELPPDTGKIKIFKQINSVLNSIDRLEVRGRDSAGISLLFILSSQDYEQFQMFIESQELQASFQKRCQGDVLGNQGISLNEALNANGDVQFALTFIYKVAAEVGSLGDNICFIREQITHDPLLQYVTTLPHLYHTVSSHTRWASVGAINECNCHPVDNRTAGKAQQKGIIHACLNGDIDNYLALKANLENKGTGIPAEITTDTKIIPLQIEHYINLGKEVAEAFRLAVNDFEGSHAICMHTDLAPGKLFLAQRGSGQAIFVGIAADHYMPASEVYGFIEETQDYLKLDGESIIEGIEGQTQGQIFVLDQSSNGGLDGITASYYDGTPIELTDKDIKHTEITSRDIDRQGFPHYFLKEISESPNSVEKTLQNRWKINDDGSGRCSVKLDETVVPKGLRHALSENSIRRIYFVGQGTAGVAALACANILDFYLQDPSMQIDALKASELSGFKINENGGSHSLQDTLVIAISQSGTTTDTNRTVDMVKERGAHTLAIVNRRDSDITFKVDGVLYTSSGRDIEMSVASTKAFYSQIIAGAVLGLFITQIKSRRNDEFIDQEIKHLLDIPLNMRKILEMKDEIAASARRVSGTKTYWAAVGSGPNKASADEIRIKLSELCYKTISSDYVEDKKHIDLSSEPLIIVCAAGTRGTVISDIVKDTAIFKAHKATPIIIADEGEDRFAPYAESVFHVPIVEEHLAPIVNTLVGHIWGYYAALAINEGSRLLSKFKEDLQQTINDRSKQGMDVYEIILEKSFREEIISFYKEFRAKRNGSAAPTPIAMASDLILLFKYLSGRLPVSDFELDFAVKGTALNMLNILFERISESINFMSRPIDAIKHQAKTVTVGTSRISEKFEGILFEALESRSLNPSQLTTTNVIVLRNLQAIVASIEGAILYRIDHLSLLGEPTDETTIEVITKEGVLKEIPSRVESDQRLQGTKRIIVRRGNVYIGKGRKDNRSILVIPILSTAPATPYLIEYLLLLNIDFKGQVALPEKIKALGGKYEHIKNIVQENNTEWNDNNLELVPIDELFGKSAEKLGEQIVSLLR